MANNEGNKSNQADSVQNPLLDIPPGSDSNKPVPDAKIRRVMESYDGPNDKLKK